MILNVVLCNMCWFLGSNFELLRTDIFSIYASQLISVDKFFRFLFRFISLIFLFQWDNSSEETPGDRIRLPSPKRMAISPLRRQALEKIIRRRKPRKWSLEEEDVLRNAVKKYAFIFILELCMSWILVM